MPARTVVQRNVTRCTEQVIQYAMLCGSAESDVALLPSNSGHRKTRANLPGTNRYGGRGPASLRSNRNFGLKFLTIAGVVNKVFCQVCPFVLWACTRYLSNSLSPIVHNSPIVSYIYSLGLSDCPSRSCNDFTTRRPKREKETQSCTVSTVCPRRVFGDGGKTATARERSLW